MLLSYFVILSSHSQQLPQLLTQVIPSLCRVDTGIGSFSQQGAIGLFAGVQIPALNFYTLGSIISQNVFDRFTSSAVDMTHKCKAERIILLFLLFKIVSFLWNPLNASKIWVVKQTCVLLTTFITVPDVPLI